MFTHNSNLLDENPVLFELNSIRQKGRFSEWSKKACPTYLYDSERHIIDVILYFKFGGGALPALRGEQIFENTTHKHWKDNTHLGWRM